MKPRKLSLEEVEQPDRVIAEFFEFAHLPQARWCLWESLKVMVSGNFGRLSSSERMQLIFFHEQIEKLIEGAHLLHERTNVPRQ